jgi:hypothetical protein
VNFIANALHHPTYTVKGPVIYINSDWKYTIEVVFHPWPQLEYVVPKIPLREIWVDGAPISALQAIVHVSAAPERMNGKIARKIV